MGAMAEENEDRAPWRFGCRAWTLGAGEGLTRTCRSATFGPRVCWGGWCPVVLGRFAAGYLLASLQRAWEWHAVEMVEGYVRLLWRRGGETLLVDAMRGGGVGFAFLRGVRLE